MNKVILAILTVTISILSVLGQDFRKATWGMSPSQVKSIEDSELYEATSDILAYKTTLGGYDALVGYYFADGKLTRARYIMAITHYNNNDFISDYEDLNGALEMKYGEPIETEILWKTDSPFKKDKSMWGYCISQGDLVLYSSYKSSNTGIQIVLNAEDYHPVIMIEYLSLSDELLNAEKEKMLKDF